MISVFKVFPIVFALITQNTFLVAATSTIQVSVCSLPSAPTILSPADGTTTTESSIDVSGIAEASSTVHIVRNTQEVASVTVSAGGSYSASASLVLGSNSLHAYVSNPCGNSANSDTITVTRNQPPSQPPSSGGGGSSTGGSGTTSSPGTTTSGDGTGSLGPTTTPETTQPSLHLSSPPDGTITSNPVVIVKGETSADIKVTMYRGEKQMATILSDDAGFFSISVPLEPGNNDIYARLNFEDNEIESNHLNITYQPPQSLSMLGGTIQMIKDALSVVAGIIADIPPATWLIFWISVLPIMWWLIKRRLEHS